VKFLEIKVPCDLILRVLDYISTISFGYILYCGCFNLFVKCVYVCVCVYVWVLQYVSVLVICVLVFTAFCIVCTVFLCCFVYVYLFLFVLSVLV
jgi:hypothetical protein